MRHRRHNLYPDVQATAVIAESDNFRLSYNYSVMLYIDWTSLTDDPNAKQNAVSMTAKGMFARTVTARNVCKNEVDTRYNIFQWRTFSRVLGHMTLHPRMPSPMPVVHILLHGISGSALAWPRIFVRPLYVWVALALASVLPFLYTYTLVNRARFASRFAARFALAITLYVRLHSIPLFMFIC